MSSPSESLTVQEWDKRNKSLVTVTGMKKKTGERIEVTRWRVSQGTKDVTERATAVGVAVAPSSLEARSNLHPAG